MLMFLRRAVLHAVAVAAFGIAAPLSAADLALVLGNANYRSMPDLRNADSYRTLARDLAREGFEVIGALDQSTDELIDAAERFRSRSADADRILIILGGHIASTSTDAWLIGTEARQPNLLNVAQSGVSLSALARLAGNASGRAVILVGPLGSGDALGTGLGVGTRGMDLPQGVTLARASTFRALQGAVFDGLLLRGQSLDEALSNVSARGFLSKTVGFTAGRGNRGDTSARSQEDGFWEAARALDTQRSLQLYLNRYPQGRFVGDARARIAGLQDDRETAWAREEAQLGLGPNDRRRIQRQLNLLGFNTNGVDGIFGGGTRRAIKSWQRGNGFEETGFLTRRQLTVLAAQANARQEERDAESARLDDDYWGRTGARGTIDGLRAYLEKYPRGRHANEARERLVVLEAEAEEDSREAARDAWRDARDRDTIQGYQEFIRNYPDSRAADAARARIQELQESDTTDLMKRARKEEKDILKNQVSRLLVEQRLVQLGYQPGLPDGNFTDQTRTALQAFQRDRQLFQSGYVTKRTAGFLLSGR